MDFDKKIIELRKKNNLTQEELAEKLNVSRQTVSNWETAKCYPDVETLVLISNEFNISLDILIKENMKMIKDIDKKVKISRKIKYPIIILFIALIICGITLYIKNNKLDTVEAKNVELQKEIRKITNVQKDNSVYLFQISKVNIKNLSLTNKNVDIYINSDLILKNARILNYYDNEGTITNSFDNLESILVEVPDDIYIILKRAEFNKDLIMLENM